MSFFCKDTCDGTKPLDIKSKIYLLSGMCTSGGMWDVYIRQGLQSGCDQYCGLEEIGHLFHLVEVSKLWMAK